MVRTWSELWRDHGFCNVPSSSLSTASSRLHSAITQHGANVKLPFTDMSGRPDCKGASGGRRNARSKLFLILLPAAALLLYFRDWRSNLMVKRNIVLGLERRCFAESNAEYGYQARVLTSGDKHLTDTADECCKVGLHGTCCLSWASWAIHAHATAFKLLCCNCRHA